MAMRDERLQKLLHAAEPDMDRATFMPAEMTKRVRILHQKRLRRRRMIVIAIPCVVAIVAVASWRLRMGDEAPLALDRQAASGRPNSGTASPVSPAIATDENAFLRRPSVKDISELNAEADFHLRIARRIVAMRQHDRAIERARDALAAQEPDGSIREQLDTVAYRMILRADALRVAMRPVEEVIVIYQDVVRLFPKTSSAELARQRLTDLGAFKGDT